MSHSDVVPGIHPALLALPLLALPCLPCPAYPTSACPALLALPLLSCPTPACPSLFALPLLLMPCLLCSALLAQPCPACSALALLIKSAWLVCNEKCVCLQSTEQLHDVDIGSEECRQSGPTLRECSGQTAGESLWDQEGTEA